MNKVKSVFLTFMLFAIGLQSPGLHAGTVAEALANPDRSEADLTRDARSNPQSVLDHFGIQAGQNVLDLFAGGGYYSEIASYVVGDGGAVILHNNQAYLGFAGEALGKRLKDDRLPAVTRYDKEVDAIDLEENSIDLVLMVMTYHDLYYKTEGWDIDPDSFFAMLHPAGHIDPQIDGDVADRQQHVRPGVALPIAHERAAPDLAGQQPVALGQ